MKTILVDDEYWGLERFEIECGNISEIELEGKFRNAADALNFARENRVDLALLDIQMPGMNGMELSSQLRELYPDIIIIFVSAYEEHLKEALKVRKADYFLVKPYTEEEVRDALERAMLLSARQRKKVSIHTFGTFEVYVDGQALVLPPKAKELLAVLVDRAGGSVTAAFAYERMWGREYRYEEASGYRNTVVKLKKALRDAGIENILAYFHAAMAVRCDMVECDYFDLMKGEKRAVQSYKGVYMEEYEWGEERVGLLNSYKMKYDPETRDELYE